MTEGPAETVSAPIPLPSQNEPSPTPTQEQPETKSKDPVETVPEQTPALLQGEPEFSANGSGDFLNIEKDEFRELIISKHVGSV